MDRLYEFRGEISIALSSSCFGLALVWQKTDTMTPVVLSGFRQLTSFLCILILKPIVDRLPIETQDKNAVDDDFGNRKFRWGVFFAVLSGIGTVFGGGFQQVALSGTTVTKVAFLQAFTVFAVPIIDALIFCSARTTSFKDILAASLAVIAMYFLSNGPSNWNDINIYDIFVIICDFGWAINICFLNLASTKINNMTLAIYDFATAALGLFLWALCIESERQQLLGNFLTQSLIDSANVILWTSFAQAIGAIFCNIGMMTVSSSKSIIIMTTEALWSAAGAYVFLGERLTTMEVIGCVIMIVAQIMVVTKVDSCELEIENELNDDEEDEPYRMVHEGKKEKMDVEMIQHSQSNSGNLSATHVINYHSITQNGV